MDTDPRRNHLEVSDPTLLVQFVNISEVKYYFEDRRAPSNMNTYVVILMTVSRFTLDTDMVLISLAGIWCSSCSVSPASKSFCRFPIDTNCIDGLYQNPVFASGDELRCELVFQELPSQRTVDHLKPQHYPIRDIKFNRLST
ncbi:hypothetical protein OROMI_013535 [Orobanche minor]